MSDKLSWIEPLLKDQNPWILHSEIEDEYAHRDAFIGNGYIGQRIGPSGDGSDFRTGSVSFMHGFWNDRNLMALPVWAVLRLHECDYGQSMMWRSPMNCRKDYHQHLNLKDGIVETKYRHITNKLNCQVQVTAFMPKHEKNLAVIRLEIESFKDNAVHAIESTLDALYCEQGVNWQIDNKDTMQAISGNMGIHAYPIQIVSHLECSEPNADKVEWVTDSKRTTRVSYYKLNKGRKLIITKWVSIRSRGDGVDLKSEAFAQVGRSIGNYDTILQKHKNEWASFWQHRIEVSQIPAQALINATLYYFGSNLREGVNWSLGPCGITGRHWGSRVFWDADLWMHPVIALLHPKLGECFTEYRIRTRDGARKNALVEGRSGACIAWEAAETGEEKVGIPEIHEQRHVNTDVVFMLRLQSFISGDETWLKEKALPLIRDIAEYWTKRCEYDEAKKKYVLKGIYCADEYAGIRDNNAHTNFCASWTLQLAYDLEKKFGIVPNENYLKIAEQMYMPWNEKRKIWDEYEGWTGQDKIKQSDTTLMIYPYEKPMTDDLKQRLNDYYTSCYESGKIMMGSAIDGVIDCELGRFEKGWSAFEDMLAHFRPPYLCVSERPTNEILNFLTGLGGVLQLVVMGFGGIRLHETEMIVEPSLPPHWGSMKMYGVHYKGNIFNIEIKNQKANIELVQKGKPCVVKDRKGNILIKI